MTLLFALLSLTSTCADTLLVTVVDGSGVKVPELEAAFGDTTITCSAAKKDPRCTAYGFAIAGSPTSIKVTVTNLKSGASTTVTLTPDYEPLTLGSGDCESSCMTASATVTVNQ